MKGHRISLMVALIVAFSALWLPSANAYLDRGSGSYIFQAVIAGALGVGVALKVFWGRIAAFFSGLFSKNDTGSTEE